MDSEQNINTTENVDVPAELNQPIVGGTGEVEVLTPQPEISAADRLAAGQAMDQAFKAIKAQPTEKIRISKLMGPQVVIINGARFNVPANVYVEVPQQVAEILRDAERI